MELGSIFLLLAVILLVGIYVSRPFFKPPETGKPGGLTNDQARDESDFYPLPADEDHNRSSLLAEYDRLLNALQELEFDHALNKIPEEDYPLQRTALLQAGTEVLKKLDAIQAAPPSQESLAEEEVSLSTSERFAAAVRTQRAPVAPVERNIPGEIEGRQPDFTEAADQKAALSEDDLERLIASHRQVRGEKASGFCPHCGRPVQKSDHYCPKCGAPLIARRAG